MVRGGKVVAHVVTFPNRRCVVSWPTSTIVYDSEDEARSVHIDHMGGRGEETVFELLCTTPTIRRGWDECFQDRCEGVPLRAVRWGRTRAIGADAPDYIPGPEQCAWSWGYEACATAMYGTDWRTICYPKSGVAA